MKTRTLTPRYQEPVILNVGAEDVDIHVLKPHPRNANTGDINAIRDSIAANGFFGRLVANRRTCHILVGNHRYLVAREMGFTQLPVEWVDVDEEGELRILLVDNRTARLGFDDNAQLSELLAELSATDAGLDGTGYTPQFLDDLIASLTETPNQSVESLRDGDGIGAGKAGATETDESSATLYFQCPGCGDWFPVTPTDLHQRPGVPEDDDGTSE